MTECIAYQLYLIENNNFFADIFNLKITLH